MLHLKHQMLMCMINDQMIFSNLAFGDFTRYVYLDEGEYNVSVYLSGQKDRPVINQMVVCLTTNIYYSSYWKFR